MTTRWIVDTGTGYAVAELDAAGRSKLVTNLTLTLPQAERSIALLRSRDQRSAAQAKQAAGRRLARYAATQHTRTHKGDAP